MTEALASRRTSITIRIPSREDSSLRSVIPSIRLSRCNSEMRSINFALLTMYGNSVTKIRSLPFGISVISTFARTVIEPFPVSYARRMPDLPMTNPPVGKSGPGKTSINSLVVTSGFSINRSIAATTSVRLCGGIFVAIPTAIPVVPLTNKLGKRAGKTTGSFSVSS